MPPLATGGANSKTASHRLLVPNVNMNYGEDIAPVWSGQLQLIMHRWSYLIVRNFISWKKLEDFPLSSSSKKTCNHQRMFCFLP